MQAARLEQPRQQILVVEDDPDIAEILAHLLRKEGYACEVAASGQQGLDAMERERFDLVVLDLMLPDMRGLDILKSIRREGDGKQTKVIILTARKDEVDRILGFELGADDYVTKPFSPRELVLRIRAVLQRTEVAEPETPKPHQRVVAGPIEVDLDFHEARVEGRSIDLTLTELRLLVELMVAAGRVRTRESLLTDVWGYDSEVLSRTVDTHVRRLRVKLGDAAGWIDTVRGVGYRIHDPGSRA